MLYWSVAQTHPQQEQTAIRNLQRQRFDAFFPFFLAKRSRFRRLAVRPVFPGYVFIQLDDAVPNWAPIHSTLGIKRLLTHLTTEEYRRPAKIQFVEDMRRLRIRGAHAGDHEVLPPGTEVRIRRGPFVERVALVELATPDRVKLLLEVFGRAVTVEFGIDDIVLVRRPTAALHQVVV